jgi:lysophospholipid acyltransferase (LPLAT)-like uncharacterized protein
MSMMAVLDATNASPGKISLRVRFIARFLYLGVRVLSWTWFIRRVHGELAPTRGEEPRVYAFWHGEQLAMIPAHADLGITGLASLSRDGSLVARVLELFGYRVVRGSSSRGGSEGLRGCIEALEQGSSVGIAVDGPRGPRHQPHPGAALMAARTRRSIIYVVSQGKPSLRLRSWDCFQIPWPLAWVRIAYGRMDAPIDQPEAIEAARLELRRRMLELSAQLVP